MVYFVQYTTKLIQKILLTSTSICRFLYLNKKPVFTPAFNEELFIFLFLKNQNSCTALSVQFQAYRPSH